MSRLDRITSLTPFAPEILTLPARLLLPLCLATPLVFAGSYGRRTHQSRADNDSKNFKRNCSASGRLLVR